MLLLHSYCQYSADTRARSTGDDKIGTPGGGSGGGGGGSSSGGSSD
ncbi:MAG: hypothetical protein ACJ71K_14215 [Nitrososphaeraceae archaeon]